MVFTRRSGWRSAAAALAVLGVLALATAQSAPTTCRTAEVLTGQTGTWTVYEAPTFEGVNSNVTAHAIDPTQPGRWFVTNGVEILASQDGGCTWARSYALTDTPSPQQPLTASSGRIHALSAAGGRALATIVGTSEIDLGEVLPDEVPDTGVRPEAGSTVTAVIASEDGGATWTPSASPMLNDGGAPGPVAQVRAEPEVVFVATGMTIRRSTDGGATFPTAFQLAGAHVPDPGSVGNDVRPTGSSVGGAVNVIAPDPVDGSVVLVRGDHYSWRSADGGVSFGPEASGPGALADGDEVPAGAVLAGPAFDRAPQGAGRVLFTYGKPKVARYLLSEDAGASYDIRGVPQYGTLSGAPAFVVSGATTPEDVVIATRRDQDAGSVYRWQPTARRFVDIDEHDLSTDLYDLRDPRVSVAGDRLTHFFSDRKLITHQLPDGGLSRLPISDQPGYDGKRPKFKLGPDGEPARPPDTDKGPAGTLTPADGVIEVPPGGSAEQAYGLELPARPSRLDTFFLLDTSGSTDPYIIALSRGLGRLAENLTSDGIDAWFGLGEYQDRGGVRYRRRSDLRPPDDKWLRYQLESIRTTGGLEPGYTAVHQAIVGSGVPKPRHGDPVPPDRNAHWRRATTRLILHVADEPFSDDPDGAGRGQAVQALRSRRVAYVGAVVTKRPLLRQATPGCEALDTEPPREVGAAQPFLEDDQNSYRLLCQMTDLAREAGTLAPQGGVDCDGDSVVDIPAGEPLVCIIQKGKVDGLPDAVRRLANAVELVQPVGLRAAPEAEVAVDATPDGDYAAINVRQDNELGFTATFSCKVEQAGEQFPVTLEALVDELPVAQARPTVRCGEKKAEPVPPPPPKAVPDPPAPQPEPDPAPVAAAAQAPVPAPLVAPNPPPPTAQVPSQAPAQAQMPASQPATGQSFQAQGSTLQAGAAEQEKQIQVAVERVRADDVPGATEFNFAGQTQDAPGEWPWLIRTLGIAGVLGAAGAAMSRRRTNTRTRKVHYR